MREIHVRGNNLLIGEYLGWFCNGLAVVRDEEHEDGQELGVHAHAQPHSCSPNNANRLNIANPKPGSFFGHLRSGAVKGSQKSMLAFMHGIDVSNEQHLFQHF